MIAELGPGHAERLLARLLELGSEGVFAFDRSGRYTIWSRALERLFGLRAEQVVGRSVHEAFPALRDSGGILALEAALGGRASNFRAQWGELDYEVGFFPLTSGDGELSGGVGLLRELSERELSERRLRETESRFRNMADASPVLLWMSRSDGLCTFFNQTWLDFTGRTMEEEWGVGWAEGVHFEDFQRCMDTYLEAFGERRQFEMEYRLRRRDGEYRWILDRGTPRYLPDGAFTGYIGSCLDITEHKRLEAELRAAVRARDEFISVASHELRTPIAALQLQLELLVRALSRAGEGGPDLAKLTQRTSRALDKTLYLGGMVNVLLDASRLGEGRLDLEVEEVELGGLAREVLDRQREAALEAGCTLELSLQAEPVGCWDRFRIAQVLTNLLSNAVKYAAGKPIRVVVSEQDGVARIEVIDQGPGISPERRGQLFSRFARLAPFKNYGGFGLGLWIAREIVRAHGGRIELDESSPIGAHFVVELPTRAGARAGLASDTRDRTLC
jgi:PAS domain S-box-containing protein